MNGKRRMWMAVAESADDEDDDLRVESDIVSLVGRRRTRSPVIKLHTSASVYVAARDILYAFERVHRPRNTTLTLYYTYWKKSTVNRMISYNSITSHIHTHAFWLTWLDTHQHKVDTPQNAGLRQYMCGREIVFFDCVSEVEVAESESRLVWNVSHARIRTRRCAFKLYSNEYTRCTCISYRRLDFAVLAHIVRTVVVYVYARKNCTKQSSFTSWFDAMCVLVRSQPKLFLFLSPSIRFGSFSLIESERAAV